MMINLTHAFITSIVLKGNVEEVMFKYETMGYVDLVK